MLSFHKCSKEFLVLFQLFFMMSMAGSVGTDVNSAETSYEEKHIFLLGELDVMDLIYKILGVFDVVL